MTRVRIDLFASLDGYTSTGHFEGIGAEIMGAAMFGLHTFPGDPD